MENPSVHPGTVYYYKTEGVPADTVLLAPEDGSSSTTEITDTDSTTDETEETTNQDADDVGEETEPTEKPEEQPAESVLNESKVNSIESNTERESLSSTSILVPRFSEGVETSSQKEDGMSVTVSSEPTVTSSSIEQLSLRSITKSIDSSSSTTEGIVSSISSTEAESEVEKDTSSETTTDSSSS